ncbi:hypothetical protein KCU90_g1965, partial [Aureobasidium melanogenum]
MQTAKQRHILALHMREECLTAERMRACHGKTDQRCTDLAVTAKRSVHGEPRTEPDARRFLVDAHRAHYLLRHPGETAHRHQLLRTLVDFVAVVADKDALFDAEHRAPQLVRFIGLPLQRGPLDPVFGRRVKRRRDIRVVQFTRCTRNRFAKHDHTSYEDRDEHAPHLPQPALMSAERISAAASIEPSGCSTDLMNSGEGAG